jgi:hypothetical protein
LAAGPVIGVLKWLDVFERQLRPAPMSVFLLSRRLGRFLLDEASVLLRTPDLGDREMESLVALHLRLRSRLAVIGDRLGRIDGLAAAQQIRVKMLAYAMHRNPGLRAQANELSRRPSLDVMDKHLEELSRESGLLSSPFSEIV